MWMVVQTPQYCGGNLESRLPVSMFSVQVQEKKSTTFGYFA